MTTPHRILLMVIGFVLAFETTAGAQIPATVRVVEQAPILRWLHPAARDVLVVVDPGTTLDVLDKDGDWYWVVTPRDVHGTRRAGWIAARLAEAVVMPVEPVVATSDSPPAVIDVPAPDAIAEKPARRDSADRTEVATAPVRVDFEDVLFDRDRFSLEPHAVSVLNAAAMVLSSDRLLRLTIEGHTCNLGTAAYNLSLGLRRATAVRDYLVSRGVAADRLHTVSLGEERPRHDNTQEATRALNRRVALVPRDR